MSTSHVIWLLVEHELSPKTGTHLSGSCSASPLLEIFVEVVEHLGAARDAFRVVLGRDADALDQRPDARDLGTAELVVLEVDVVDDLADGAQRRVLERAALEQHLERALVALVRELGLVHVETQLAVGRAISLAPHDLPAGVGLDETRDVPCDGAPRAIGGWCRGTRPVAQRASGASGRFACWSVLRRAVIACLWP